MGFLRKVVSAGTLGIVPAAASKKKKPIVAPQIPSLPTVDPNADPYAGQQPMSQGLGQMPSYLPPPVSMQQAVPQGLGSNVFRSTLAPLQQQGYGLAQIDPRLLTGMARFPGGMIR